MTRNICQRYLGTEINFDNTVMSLYVMCNHEEFQKNFCNNGLLARQKSNLFCYTVLQTATLFQQSIITLICQTFIDGSQFKSKHLVQVVDEQLCLILVS